MPSGIVIRAVAIIISLVFFAGIWLTTGSPEFTFLRFLSAGVLVATLALAVWDKWLWKVPLFQGIPGVNRNVSGTWRATLESFWIDPATEARIPVKEVFVVIRQTSSSASVTLISDESRSTSSIARVIKEKDAWLIHYIYTNEPDVTVIDRSPIHHGSGVLTIIGRPAQRVVGSYWTDRDTKGKLTLDRRSPKLGEDFDGCANLFRP